ncbi:siphovirus ReqiPepy6 Gp37-like family protein [Streptomyces sp. NPDC055036]
MRYRVEVFDRNLKRVGEIDEWISLDFTVRLIQEGSWQLLVKADSHQASLIEKGGGIVIWQEGVSKPLLSGQIDVFQTYWTTVQHTGRGSIYLGGKCHNTLAYRRLAFPDPTKPISNQYQAALAARQWTSAATAGGMIYSELNQSLGPGALADRRVPNVNLTPSTLGQGISDTMRFDVLGTKFDEWYSLKDVAYRLIYNPDTQKIDLEVFKPRDLSKDIRFSPELGNLREYIWTLSAPKVTRVIVGCAGDGLERYYYQKTDTAAETEWGLQIEQFLDRRDIQVKVDKATGNLVKADPEMTNQEFTDAKAAVVDAADTALKEGTGTGNFQIYPIDTDDCLFGRDYFVGDKVTVAVEGVEYSDVVREVVISVDDGGNTQSVSPKIGQQGSGEPLNLYKTVYDLQKKLRKLETRM